MNYIEYYGPNADGVPEDMPKRIFVTDSVAEIPGVAVTVAVADEELAAIMKQKHIVDFLELKKLEKVAGGDL